ncbi:hypothetical protein V7128_01860 [Neobacillus vireti]|uniref:hypothetical protein n=1 Tax=Neobacillus vireti TaxID=220686 RepID=UPI002FFDA097
MEYKNYAKETDTTMATSIHTRINAEIRISSVYRKFSNINFEDWGWETFLWKDMDIEKQYDILNSADQVVDLHTQIFKEFNQSN